MLGEVEEGTEDEQEKLSEDSQLLGSANVASRRCGTRRVQRSARISPSATCR